MTYRVCVLLTIHKHKADHDHVTLSLLITCGWRLRDYNCLSPSASLATPDRICSGEAAAYVRRITDGSTGATTASASSVSYTTDIEL